MRRILSVFIISLLLFQPLIASALSSSEAKQAWFEAKQASREAQDAHRKANIEWASDKTDENNQVVIDTGKEALLAALDEARTWLVWRKMEIIENPEVPDKLKSTILEDIEANLVKINELQDDVNEVDNRIELALVFLKMVGKYLELVTDVARNTGLVWVHIANTYADTIQDYETQLRDAAANMEDNEGILEKLDIALNELESARENIDNAEVEYQLVIIPGNPIFKFANGNQYLRIAKNNLLTAHTNLKQAYRLLVEAS